MRGETVRSRFLRRSRIPFLLLCGVTVLPLGGCRSDTSPPVTPAATKPEKSADFQIVPVLREFLQRLPADWYLVSARDVATAKPFVVDVRQPDEYAGGFIEGAVNIPLRQLATSLQTLPATDRRTVLVCDTGHRSAIALAVLQMLGYTNARSLEGGLRAWQEAKLAVVTAPVPRRAVGPAPKVDSRLQAVLDYYLVHTLPFNWGVMDAAVLTRDQQLLSSAEIEANADFFEQGHSYLTNVDEPSEFATVIDGRAKLAESINLPLRSLTERLDRIPIQQAIAKA
jgi:rhodanese-related sulfurtransferase